MLAARHAVTAMFGPLTDEERQTIRELHEFDTDDGYVGTTPNEGGAVHETVTFVLDDSEDDALSWLESRLRGWRLPFIAFQTTPAPGSDTPRFPQTTTPSQVSRPGASMLVPNGSGFEPTCRVSPPSQLLSGSGFRVGGSSCASLASWSASAFDIRERDRVRLTTETATHRKVVLPAVADRADGTATASAPTTGSGATPRSA